MLCRVHDRNHVAGFIWVLQAKPDALECVHLVDCLRRESQHCLAVQSSRSNVVGAGESSLHTAFGAANDQSNWWAARLEQRHSHGESVDEHEDL